MLLPGFVVAGIGVGITNPVLASATVSVVPAERSGMATGSSSTFRQVGISTGIAGLGAVFLSQIRTNTTTALTGSAGGQAVLAHGDSRLSTAISGSGIREAAASLRNVGARDALIGAYKVGFSSTFDHLMAIASVIALVGAVGSLVLVRQRDFVPSHSPGEVIGEPTGGATDQALGGDGETTTGEAPPPRRPRHAHSKRRQPAAAPISGTDHDPGGNGLEVTGRTPVRLRCRRRDRLTIRTCCRRSPIHQPTGRRTSPIRPGCLSIVPTGPGSSRPTTKPCGAATRAISTRKAGCSS